MKIVHYSTQLSRSAGGLFYSVSNLARQETQLGADVSVVGGADGHYEADKGQWDGVHAVPHDLGLGNYALSTKAISSILSLKPDLLHVHGIWSAASLYGLLSALRGTSIVVSPRGMLDPWILARRPLVKSVHGALFERPLLRRSHLHALNESELASASRYLPGLAERSFVLPNGTNEVDIDETAARDGVLYLGRLHEKKQVIELVQHWSAAPQLAGLPLTVAGWGDPAYEAALATAAAGLPNLTLAGPLYGAEKVAALAKAQYFILPSLSEGLPMAVLEALQSGAIPVITEECNLPELFADDIALSIRTDMSDLTEVMAAAIARPSAEVSAHSRRAREYSRRYLWSNIARQMLDRYDDIVSKDQA